MSYQRAFAEMRLQFGLVLFLLVVVSVFLQTSSALGAANSEAAAEQSRDLWDGPAFSADPVKLAAALSSLPEPKDAGCEIILTEAKYVFDKKGHRQFVVHVIARCFNKEGLKYLSKISIPWAPWSQRKPELRARVISPDGSVHTF